MENVLWEGNTANIPWTRKHNGSTRSGFRRIDFDALKIQRKGLLEDALTEITQPLQASVANQTVRMVELHKNNPVVIKILGTRTDHLKVQDIVRLYDEFENTIKKTGSISVETQNTVSTQYRSIISKCSGLLIAGANVKSVRFKSCFISHMSGKGKLAAAKKKAGKSMLNEERLSTIKHDDTESLRAGLLAAATEDLNSIENACWEAVKSYKETRDYHRNLLQQYRDQPIPKTLHWKTDPAKALGFKLVELERKNFFQLDGFRKLMTPNYKGTVAVAFGLMCGYPKVYNPFSPRWDTSQVSIRDYIYCSYYLPRVVIIAAQILCHIKTGWNVSTVADLTQRHILTKLGYFVINSVKSKTNDSDSYKVYKSSNPEFYELIEMIIEHNLNIDKYWRREHESIWVGWSTDRNNYDFRVMSDGLEVEYIAKPFGLPNFNKSQFRDQVNGIEYLKDLDPFKVKERLGHKDINTTLVYLNHLVLRLLHRSNIKRFMDRLAATIVWVVGGTQAVNDHGMALAEVDERILFPVGGNGAGQPNICDNWINSLGTCEIKIGRAEIEHLKYQIELYKEHYLTLRQGNPKAFVMFHVPRMLFCSALAELVRNSPYHTFLN